MEKPIITVIIPAYNAEKYIGEAIKSVLNQSYNNLELIIINDGSTDNTLSVIKAFSDKRIRLIEQENFGVSSARNKGLAQAQGKYITFLDADDLLPVNSLASRVNFLESNPDVDVVDGNIKVMDKNMDKVIRTYKPYHQGLLLPKLLKLDSRVFFNVCYMFKKGKLGGTRFNENMTHAEDLLFYMELSNKQQARYGFVDEAVYYYRSGHVSAMINMDGLEQGYFLLLSRIRKLETVKLRHMVFIRVKIARILFLCRLKRKEYMLGVKSSFRALNLIK